MTLSQYHKNVFIFLYEHHYILYVELFDKLFSIFNKKKNNNGNTIVIIYKTNKRNSLEVNPRFFDKFNVLCVQDFFLFFTKAISLDYSFYFRNISNEYDIMYILGNVNLLKICSCTRIYLHKIIRLKFSFEI